MFPRNKQLLKKWERVKTAHPSHWGDLQLMAYQMDNSVPTTDKEVLGRITECGVNF